MINGILLALQFFTIVPVNKELNMNRKSLTAMFAAIPWLGAGIGSVTASLWLLMDASPLFVAFLIVLASIILSGGLHLDGFADTSDAFFSYRGLEKRHEILADPRIGAFGAMALMLFIIGKIVLLTEIIVQNKMEWGWLLAIPFLARAGMVYFLIITPAASEQGLAAFFKKRFDHRLVLGSVMISMIVGAAFILFVAGNVPVTVFSLIALFACAHAFKYWAKKHFGGVTGDLSGAFAEGVELVLWLLIFSLL